VWQALPPLVRHGIEGLRRGVQLRAVILPRFDPHCGGLGGAVVADADDALALVAIHYAAATQGLHAHKQFHELLPETT